MNSYKKRCLPFLLSMCICALINAQLPEYLNFRSEKSTNMFIYGDSVITPENNFENLFRNFSLFVRNSDEFDLLSYEYVCTLNNKNQSKVYLRKNSQIFQEWLVYTSIGSFNYSSDTREKKYTSGSFIEIFKSTGPVESESKSERKNRINTLAENYLSIGDKVYKIEFIYCLQKYEYYMFVNSRTNQIVKQGNIFAQELPLASMSLSLQEDARIVLDFPTICSDSIMVQDKPSTWQEQLEYAKKNNNLKTRDGNTTIELVGHTYLGTVKSEAEILEQLFSADAVTVQYIDSETFEIVSISVIMENAKALGIDDPFAELKSQLKASIKVGMELIKLEWRYKGKTYYSIAIADNDNGGIIYEHIGYMISDKVEHKSESYNSGI